MRGSILGRDGPPAAGRASELGPMGTGREKAEGAGGTRRREDGMPRCVCGR